MLTCENCGQKLFDLIPNGDFAPGWRAFWKGHALEILCGDCGHYLGRLFGDKDLPIGSHAAFCARQHAGESDDELAGNAWDAWLTEIRGIAGDNDAASARHAAAGTTPYLEEACNPPKTE